MPAQPEPSRPVTAAADPELIRDAHLFLLDRLGRSMGLAFHPRPLSDPPIEECIAVFGRFDPKAAQREFGLQLSAEEVGANRRRARVAWVIDFYIPESHRRQGFGTKLMSDLLELWRRIGVAEARLTATGEGRPAYESWGFVPDHSRDPLDASLQPMRLKLV